MKTELKFENNDTKELLTKCNFVFFMQRIIEKHEYTKDELLAYDNEYKNTMTYLNDLLKINKYQYNLYIESQVSRSFSNGYLPCIFNLIPQMSDFDITDFKGTGVERAYFEVWQKFYKNKLTFRKLHKWYVNIGTLLAIILTAIKIIEAYKKN